MNRIINLIVIGSVVLFTADPVSKAMKEEKKYKAAEHKERESIKQEEKEIEKKGNVFKEASIKKKSYPRGTIETH
ncbi:hypothetical protein [Sulfuricurvum sp.]|uniref:hypothetical protein n=1 Tax=Sulfuricurvum sp. TaxID=2025608 RepID=UPI003BAFA2A2